MKKRVISLVVFLLITCLMLSGCSSESLNPQETAEPAMRDADGMYEWTVRGATLRTKTNIYDYVNNGIWDSIGFAESLGMVNMNKDQMYKRALGFETDDFYVRFLTNAANDPTRKYVFCYGLWFQSNDGLALGVNFVDILRAGNVCEYLIDGEHTQASISFEVIVAYTYACERLLDDSSTDPFEGIFEEAENYYYNLE